MKQLNKINIYIKKMFYKLKLFKGDAIPLFFKTGPIKYSKFC